MSSPLIDPCTVYLGARRDDGLRLIVTPNRYLKRVGMKISLELFETETVHM